MKKLIIFGLLLAAPLANAQSRIVGGGGSVSSGSSISGCTINSLVYIDASGNLACPGSPAPTFVSSVLGLNSDGTASLPAFGWAADMDGSGTGFYRITANQIGWTSNGSAAGRFASYLGIDGYIRFALSAGLNFTDNASSGGGTEDTFLSRDAAATIQLGQDLNGTAISQTLKGPDGITGTDKSGGSFTVLPGKGTGAGTGAQVNLGRNITLATGTTQQSQIPSAFTTCPSKILSNSTGTATAIVNITLPNNSAGAGRATISVQCSDGTNFDADLVTSYDSYVNKAGTLTIGTAVTTGTSAANNSGSCTIAPTWVANGTTSIDLKVTPVISTISPTTTTTTVNFENLGGILGGGGVVTCK